MKNITYLCSAKQKAAMKKRKLIFLVLLLLPGWLPAQERIIEVQNLNDVSSIVRETSDGLWLVYNYSYGQSRFSLVDESQTTTPQLLFGYIEGTDSTRINDFEIFRDTVYFCGQTWRGKESSSIWGYFPMQGFPYVPVRYHESGADYFSKIDVFSIDTTTADLHIVMVKKNNQFHFQLDYIYDIVRTASNVYWEHSAAFYDLTSNSTLFDVAETDNNVVLSTYNQKGSVFFFNKPTTPSTTFLSGTAIFYGLNSSGTFNVLLENCKNDAVVATYKDLLGGIRVYSFIATSSYSALEICNSDALSPYDIKFDKISEDLDILAYNFTLSTRADSSMIYHLNPSLASNGGPVFCHKYIGEVLNSLEWLSTKRNCFVSSGHDENQQHLRLYEYCYHNWENCTEQIIVESIKMEMGKKETMNVKSSKQLIEMIDLASYDMETPLKIKCE